MFDRQPRLTDGIYTLEPLTHTHKSALQAAASDPTIWAGHPANDRHLPDVFETYFATLLNIGGTLRITHQDDTIGCSTFYTSSDQPGTISVGYTFLTTAYWGGTANRAIKHLMFDHAFQTFDTVWLHIAPTNIRSQKATQKLGAVYTRTATSDTGAGPRRAQYYRLDRSVWRDRVGK